MAQRGIRRLVPASGEPIRLEGDPESRSALGPSVPQRQAPGRSSANVRTIYSRVDQLLQPLLQIGPLLNTEADRRPSVTLGSAQVQTSEATTEACANVAGRSDQTYAGALPPLAAFICKRPDAGSRMSRETHVRFCERAVVKFHRATRLIILKERHLRRVLSSYFQYHHNARTHLSLKKDCPRPRRVQLPSAGNIIAF